MPSAEPSPRPWRVEENVVGWHSFIVDANGDGIVACWRTARGDDEKERQYNEANAALVVDAVNERDELKADNLALANGVIENRDRARRLRAERYRLRDLVRRLLPLAKTTVENIRALGTARFPFLEQIKSDRLRGDINREVANADYLLREARAAIGEEDRK